MVACHMHCSVPDIKSGIHTGGGRGGLPPLPPFENFPPPLLNQHKYYNKVVLKQQSDKCCSKMVCICSKTPIIFFQRCILAVKTALFPGRWEVSDGFPPFLKNPV